MSESVAIKQLPPGLTAVPPGVTDPLAIYAGCVTLLVRAYLCMRANGTNDHQTVPEEYRSWFEYWTREGLLWALVEHIRHGALIESQCYGFHLEDVALTPTCMHGVALGQQSLTDRDHNELSLAIDHLMALDRRISAAEELRDLREAARTRPSIVVRGIERGPQKPRSKLLPASALVDALGLPPEREPAVTQALRRLSESNPSAKSTVENPRRGEPTVVYRVDIVWPALVEALPRWRDLSGFDS